MTAILLKHANGIKVMFKVIILFNQYIQTVLKETFNSYLFQQLFNQHIPFKQYFK